jgi:hypothetical protein
MIPYHKTGSSLRPRSRITDLAGELSVSVFRNFRQLSIQLPIQKDDNPQQFFRLVAAGLVQLAPVLQDLRMFFIGEDGFGTSTNYIGCGLRVYSCQQCAYTRKLPKEGSCYAERGSVFRAVKNLYFLHNLVLSNANYPLLQSLIGYKPGLKTLCLVADSRSVLYKHPGGPLVEWQPPAALHTLQISANAVLGATNVVLSVMHSLKDLTFLIPSTKWQEREWNWLEHVSVVVQCLGMRAKRLRRFRFCIEQPLREENSGRFLGALRQYLPHTSLQVLEIHATLDSPYFGRELIEALPKTLKQLHVSQELVSAKCVVDAVTDRYFKVTGEQKEAGSLGFVGFEYWERESTKLALLRMNGALLDRARNAHLFDGPQDSRCLFGGGSVPLRKGHLRRFTVGELGDDVMSMEDVPEGALAHYHDMTVEHITEPEMVFHAEEVAKAEERVPFLVIPGNFEVGENDHWMTD